MDQQYTVMKRYKTEDVKLVASEFDPSDGRPYDPTYDGRTLRFVTDDGEFHTEPAPGSGANYWLDKQGNPLPARDKRDVAMVYEGAWKEDAVKTLNRLLARQAKDDRRLKLWFAAQDAYKKKG